LQRLFSTFPDGWPGAGLLLLRLAAAIPLVIAGSPQLPGLPPSAPIPVHVIAVVTGIFLFAGFWTPFAALLQAVIEIWIVYSAAGEAGIHLLLAALGLGLVMLGPGAWSVDARLYGRKRIEIRTR
jgi:putative oxidoreductase